MQQDRYAAEGVRLLEEALRHGTMPEVLYYSESLMSDRAGEVLSEIQGRGTPVERLSARQLESISDTRSSQGLLGLFAPVRCNLSELPQSGSRRLLWCDGISDPGNLGTLLRSALAFGFGTVVTSGPTADPYAPKVVRSSVGAMFGLRLIEATVDEILAMVRDEKRILVAADVNGNSNGSQLARELKSHKVILAVGSEAEGLAGEILSAAKHRVRLDHLPTVESLNAAVAGSILMHMISQFKRS